MTRSDRPARVGGCPDEKTAGSTTSCVRCVITRGFTSHPAGSVLVEFGQTRVMCTASVTEGVPRWRKGSGLGWLTAEYAMLPAATHERSDRESVKGQVGGRTQEISRLVGRSLRACIDLAALGENTIAIDCDVLQADGGTRTAAITGAYVALADAVTYLAAAGELSDPRPLSCAIAAVSVGVVDGRVRTDLPYTEDSRAEVDMNVVATDTGTLVEIQGTGEGATFPRSTLDKMLDAALAACEQLFVVQREALELPYPGVLPESGGAGEEGVRKLGVLDEADDDVAVGNGFDGEDERGFVKRCRAALVRLRPDVALPVQFPSFAGLHDMDAVWSARVHGERSRIAGVVLFGLEDGPGIGPGGWVGRGRDCQRDLCADEGCAECQSASEGDHRCLLYLPMLVRAAEQPV